MTIDLETYLRERALVRAADRIMETLAPEVAQRGGAIPEVVTSHPDYRAVNNDMRGRVQQYELLTDTPERFVAYVGDSLNDGMGLDRSYRSRRALNVWTGLPIGTCFLSSSWKVNSYIGDRMYQIYATVNGRQFTGRGFGQGMAVVLRETAASKRKRRLRVNLSADTNGFRQGVESALASVGELREEGR
jgi:hypothetical protein